jgi:hypothetical protein
MGFVCDLDRPQEFPPSEGNELSRAIYDERNQTQKIIAWIFCHMPIILHG